MVVANDVDVARCYLLTHVVQRLGSPCYMVMNYPAQYFPTMQLNGVFIECSAVLDSESIMTSVLCSIKLSDFS